MTPQPVPALLSLLAAYLLGAVPFSLLVGKLFFHVDLRERGSGNLGATNTFRELGWKAGLAVALLDLAKGASAALFARWLLAATGTPDPAPWFPLLVVIAAMAGHTYSPYIRFAGGKGIAAAGGALFATMPLGTALLFTAFVAIIAITRIVSVGSISVAFAFPFAVWAFYTRDPASLVIAVCAAVLALWRHRSNISRIIHGTERKLTRVDDATDGEG